MLSVDNFYRRVLSFPTNTTKVRYEKTVDFCTLNVLFNAPKVSLHAGIRSWSRESKRIEENETFAVRVVNRSRIKKMLEPELRVRAKKN